MTDDIKPLTGPALLLAGMVLALTNFMVVLDTTIANVSVTHIAGALGISSTQGTWVITSYAVAEAICVPLTGWLTGRFGAVRTFTWGMIGFGLFSFLCGLSNSLAMLVVCRIGQGLCGGPLMPLSQTLMLRVFPKRQHGQAMSLWATTTVVAPIIGPILGGTISDGWSWNWIFFINVPVAAVCAYGALRLLKSAETRIERLSVDKVGLMLLILWVGAFQLMLDLGREHDWFNDGMIVTLAVIAAIGLALFVAWEVTAKQPIVDLRVFRHRGFTVSVTSLSFAFAVFFVAAVLIPQWLQQNLGYTATYAGYVTAFSGVGAVLVSPLVVSLSTRFDPRALVFFGILWMGITSLLRVQWASNADFWTLSLPQLLQGVGLPFFIVPLTTIGLGAVKPEETASAAGIMSFLRTMAGAVGTSISTTMFADGAVVARSEIVSKLNSDATSQTLTNSGFSLEQIRAVIEQTVVQESYALSIDHVFLLSAITFAVAATIIWLAPRPDRAVEAGAMH
ncbi:DHA2 family efflux MFS transporter permease subunit [Sphingobium sp.]|uniref:DHA2 family efflux MFS transporter permease subunit n=1 Tax=Sphingobium sp. TaxID=1912891 RepID=UPI0028BE6850|nr:DHA2 family efflux MFS transporter permease subunit [Sphingobium sp.]